MTTQRIARVGAWTCLTFVILVTLSPISLRPHDVLPVNWGRAIVFALMAALFVVGYPKHTLLCGALVAVSACMIELLQFLSPSRHARFDDAAVKAAGALVGLLVGWAVNRVHSAKES